MRYNQHGRGLPPPIAKSFNIFPHLSSGSETALPSNDGHLQEMDCPAPKLATDPQSAGNWF